MNKRVWIFQYASHVVKRGDKASWYVGWYDLDEKRHAESCGPGARGKNVAEKRKRRIQSELDTGIHRPAGKVKWQQFRVEYESRAFPRLAARSVPQVKAALNHFERICKPGRVELIDAGTIDDFVKVRITERGKKPGSKVSPATVNKDLRHLKAALRDAAEWGYLPRVPRIKRLREIEKEPRYIPPEDFTTIYREACPLVKLPANPDQHYTACEWWQALIVTAYMTGLRISEVLSIRREDVDLDSGQLTTRGIDNKSKRDETLPLHPVVCEHLRKIVGFHPLVFRWAHDERALWTEFGRIQREAGIHAPCNLPTKHEHTPACHVYGFHDCRRAFATMNDVPDLTLQRLMRHKSLTTTKLYVNMRNRLQKATDNLYVPEALRASGAGA